jgi:hypothetical protein
MSDLPLLDSVDGSSRYDATSSRSSDDGPTLPLDDIDRPIVEKKASPQVGPPSSIPSSGLHHEHRESLYLVFP